MKTTKPTSERFYAHGGTRHILARCAWCNGPASGVVVEGRETEVDCLRCWEAAERAAARDPAPATREARVDGLLSFLKTGNSVRALATARGIATLDVVCEIERYGVVRPDGKRAVAQQSRPITIRGVTKTAGQWSVEKGVPARTLAWRHANGWPEDKLFAAARPGRSLASRVRNEG